MERVGGKVLSREMGSSRRLHLLPLTCYSLGFAVCCLLGRPDQINLWNSRSLPCAELSSSGTTQPFGSCSRRMSSLWFLPELSFNLVSLLSLQLDLWKSPLPSVILQMSWSLLSVCGKSNPSWGVHGLEWRVTVEDLQVGRGCCPLHWSCIGTASQRDLEHFQVLALLFPVNRWRHWGIWK